MRHLLASSAFVTLAVAVVAGCGAGDPPSRSGADVEPVKLRATSYEPGGSIGAVTLAEFARRASARSNGAIKIEVGPDPDSSRPDTSAEKIAEIRKGYYDLGIVAARSFDKLGVPAFQALQAPFLVTSNELGERILEDGIADEMLDTLDRLSLEGLALTYADRRFPLGYGAPLVSIDDYRGKSVAARPSAATYATLRALGAAPTLVNGGDLAAAAEAGTVVGSEGVLAWNRPVSPGTITANTSWYFKANALVVNRSVFEGLSGAQREVLRQAAMETQAWAAGQHTDDATAVARYCADGNGAVVVATDEQLRELLAAVAPVYTAMERDPLSKKAITRIRELAGETPAPRPAPCTPRASAKPTFTVAARGDQSVLDGTWRLSVLARNLEAAGGPADLVGLNKGVWTFHLKGGEGTVDQPRGNPCLVAYQIDDNRIVFDFGARPGSGCGGKIEGTFELSGGAASFNWTKDDSGDPIAWDNAFWKGGLRRVGEAPRSKQSVVDGKWRVNIEARSMLGHPDFTKEEAYGNAGVWTFTFKNGSYAFVEPNGRRSCKGTFFIEGTLITMTETSPGCDGVWTASFVRSGDRLQFAAPPSDPASWIGAFLTEPLKRIGDAP